METQFTNRACAIAPAAWRYLPRSAAPCRASPVIRSCPARRVSRQTRGTVRDTAAGSTGGRIISRRIDLRRASMFGRRGCCRCHRKRNAEKDCKGKRDLSHRERYLKSSTLTSTDQGGGKRQARMARRSWYYRVAVKLIFVIFGILGASAAQAQNAPWFADFVFGRLPKLHLRHV